MAELVYAPVIGTALGLFRALDLRFTQSGSERIPRTGGAVLASNHVSYLDYLFAGRAARYPHHRFLRFMAKKEIFDKPLGGPFMRSMGHVPVDRSAGTASYEQALAALGTGELIGIYPEATISLSWELKPLKTGAARLAIASGTPLVPLVTWGGQRLLTKGHKPRLQRHVPVTIAVGEPLRPAAGDDPETVTAELAGAMRALLAQVQESYPDQPSGPADAWWQPARLGGTAPTLAEAEARDERARAKRAADRARREGSPPPAAA